MSESGEASGGRTPPPGPWPSAAEGESAQWTAAADAATPTWASSPDGDAGSSLAAAPQPLYVERPEIIIGAAFVGGLLLAMLLKRLAR